MAFIEVYVMMKMYEGYKSFRQASVYKIEEFKIKYVGFVCGYVLLLVMIGILTKGV